MSASEVNFLIVATLLLNKPSSVAAIVTVAPLIEGLVAVIGKLTNCPELFKYCQLPLVTVSDKIALKVILDGDTVDWSAAYLNTLCPIILQVFTVAAFLTKLKVI